MTKKLKGEPPKVLTGPLPASSLDSPWWDQVMIDVTLSPGMVGRTISIEELTQIIPSYPDGRRPRPRTVARRLRSMMTLVERGPNGSRGRGATYRIDGRPIEKPVDASDDLITFDDEWLNQSVEKMTKRK